MAFSCPQNYDSLHQKLMLDNTGNIEYYKSIIQYNLKEDRKLMFNNTRTYNQEGSWGYKEDWKLMFNNVQWRR